MSSQSFHAFRHGTATALLSSGASTRDVQAILGHSSVNVTGKYLHITEGRLKFVLVSAFDQSKRI